MGVFDEFEKDWENPKEVSPEVAEHLEGACLEPELVEVPEVGEVSVIGDPFGIGEKLEDNQGHNFYNFQGDCGLVTVLNILTMAGIDTSEDEVVGRAIVMGRCRYSELNRPEDNGGTTVMDRKAMLETYGISSTVMEGKSAGASPEALARYVAAGHGVNISFNCGYAWDEPSCIGDGSVNHSVAVTGAAWDKDTGELKGLFVCDSGLTDRDSKVVFMSVDVLNEAYVNAPGSAALVTNEPIR